MSAIKNVVVVCDYGYIEGGAARIAQDTARILSQSGLAVYLFFALGPIADELKSVGVHAVCLEQSDILHEKNRIKGILRGIYNTKAKKEFTKLLSSLDPRETIIHVHTWTKGVSSSIFKVAEKKHFQVVLTVHDYFLVCPNGGLFNYQTSKICDLRPMSAKCIACHCDARSYSQKLFRVFRQWMQNRNIRPRKNISYIFISDFSKREFLKRYSGIPQEKQYFLTNVIRFDEQRERVLCEQNDTYLFIGGLTEVKGIRVFCEAVTQSGVKAVVIGTGILEEELKQQYPAVWFVGWKSKEDMKPYLAQARCLVFPSIWYEASPLTPLEVMALGIPVICSDLNAASDLIRGGENGLLYPSNSVSSLAAAIEETKSDDLVKRLSEYAFQHFDADKYSEECYVRDLMKLYEEICRE